jgi:hypothetical protein
MIGGRDASSRNYLFSSYALFLSNCWSRHLHLVPVQVYARRAWATRPTIYHNAFKYSFINAKAMAPSPTAEATR